MLRRLWATARIHGPSLWSAWKGNGCVFAGFPLGAHIKRVPICFGIFPVLLWDVFLDFLSWNWQVRSPLVLLRFDLFCTSAVNIPGIVLTRQHPFQHAQHHVLDSLGWACGFRLARVGSWWVPGLFKASSRVMSQNLTG